MILIVLASDPMRSSFYEMGIETSINFSDAGTDVEVVIEGDFLRALKNSDDNSVYLKKLRQLALYDIKTYTFDDDSRLFEIFKGLIKTSDRRFFDNKKVVVF
ncbi:MAG: hypothetical protein ACI4M9_08100 [Succinivibrio sp.]